MKVFFKLQIGVICVLLLSCTHQKKSNRRNRDRQQTERKLEDDSMPLENEAYNSHNMEMQEYDHSHQFDGVNDHHAVEEGNMNQYDYDEDALNQTFMNSNQ
jgi:hypothetical protein